MKCGFLAYRFTKIKVTNYYGRLIDLTEKFNFYSWDPYHISLKSHSQTFFLFLKKKKSQPEDEGVNYAKPHKRFQTLL